MRSAPGASDPQGPRLFVFTAGLTLPSPFSLPIDFEKIDPDPEHLKKF